MRALRHGVLLGTCLVLVSAGSSPSIQAKPGQPSNKSKQVRVDQYGDPLPDGAISRLGTVRWHHGAKITSLAFTLKGKAAVSAGEDGSICVWDAANGKEARIDGSGLSAAVVFSTDGKLFANASSDDIR